MVFSRQLVGICVLALALNSWRDGKSASSSKSEGSTGPSVRWTKTVLTPAAEGVNKPRGLGSADATFSGIAFLDEHRVVVYELALTGKLSSRTNADAASEYGLHSSILDSRSGRLIGTRDWNARLYDSWIQATSGGLLVRTGRAIKFFSKDLVELKTKLLSESGASDRWEVRVSPTGKTILINHYDKELSRFEVIDGNTFELRSAWEENPPLRHLYSISDSAIAAANYDQSRIILGEFGGGKWQTLNKTFKPGCVYIPTFLSADVLANVGCGREISLFSTKGQAVMNAALGKDESVDGDKIRAAPNGRFIAAAILKSKGGGFLDTNVRRIGCRIAVYDLRLQQQAWSADLCSSPLSNYDFAFSPDSSQLAILADRKVSVFSLSR